MVFSLSVDNDLFQLLGIFHNDGRIFKMYFIQSFTKLFVITFTLCLDSCTVFRCRKFYSFISPIITRNIESMVYLGILELYQRSYISDMQLRNTCPVFTRTNIKL